MKITTIIRDHLQSSAFANEEAGHRLFPIKDWKYEVDSDSTSRGYADWLENIIDSEAFDVDNAVERLLHGASRASFGDQTSEGFAAVVQDCFTVFRALDSEAADRARDTLGEEPRDLLFGETVRSLPLNFLAGLDRIAHLGMAFYEGRVTQEKVDQAIHEFGLAYDLESEEVDLARRRQGLEIERPTL